MPEGYGERRPDIRPFGNTSGSERVVAPAQTP